MPTVNELLRKLSFAPDEKELRETDKRVKIFVKELKKQMPNSQVFLGGSFAKGTIVRKKIIDVDIFVRLSKEGFKLGKLEKAIKKITNKFGYESSLVHGSRDYL